ncbi:hypothetical protein GQX74_011354 [Glossina fuscipes]|nr:hypothetical protein GQX74_011354 [Glossina fuscipes]
MSNGCKIFQKLGLGCELFNINANTKSVEPQEALSVKKSVEVAAIFGDVNLAKQLIFKANEVCRYNAAQWETHAQRLSVFMIQCFVYSLGLAALTVAAETLMKSNDHHGHQGGSDGSHH